MTKVPGYRINEKVYNSSNISVYRGEREEDDLPVIIKTSTTDYPAPMTLAQLTNEYDFTVGLNAKHILKAYELIKHNNSVYLILEDIGGYSLRDRLKQNKMGIEEFFAIAIALSGSLEEVYRNNIIHRSITPEHIIINPRTAQVKLTSFGRATSRIYEQLKIDDIDLIEGHLAYISPEQTGRMGRGEDYRTDFYSMGVTFYEMLTGYLPFQATDPLELIHSHIARQPVPPHESDPTIPRIVSQLVLKMMAKTAEERYQSGIGLKADLEECLRRMKTFGKVEEFPLGEHDVPEELLFAPGLYGREEEINALTEQFRQVSRGEKQLVLVSGNVGVGKTSLVEELAGPVFDRSGFFVTGESDRLKNDIPYHSLISALQDLTRILLSEPLGRIEKIKSNLLSALGSNGQVIIDVIPDIEYIIGPQPPVSKLSPTESHNRFHLVFLNFIEVFCQEEHPVVIFLDNFQWVDTATLELIEVIMSSERSRFLMIIGAFRNNEVESSHPLKRLVDSLSQKGLPVSHMELMPLSADCISLYMCDTLSTGHEDIDDFARLIAQKTNGNPFYLTQFLMKLHMEGALSYDPGERGWVWDLPKIEAVAVTENVVDLLIGRLKRFPLEGRQVLSQAACIGNRFDIDTLKQITHLGMTELLEILQPFFRERLIVAESGTPLRDFGNRKSVKESDTFRFQHERIQQAAYSLMDQTERTEAHLQIGRLIQKKAGKDDWGDQIFECLSHLNKVISLITLPTEKSELAALNRDAGRKAKESVAFSSAYDYLIQAINLLEEHSWEQQYGFTLNLHDEAAEAAYLSGHYLELEEVAACVMKNAQKPIDMVNVYQSRIMAYLSQNRSLDARKAGLDILGSLGISSLETPLEQLAYVGQYPVSHFSVTDFEKALSTAPNITNPAKLAVLRIMADLTVPCRVTDPKMLSLLVQRAMEIIIKNGNSYLNPFFYCCYALQLCSELETVEVGYQFGKLGLMSLEKIDSKTFEPSTHLIFNKNIRYFKEHLRNSLDPLLNIYRAALEAGDLQHAANSVSTYCFYAFLAGMNLQWVEGKMNVYSDVIREIDQKLALTFTEISQQTVLNLIGSPQDPSILAGDVYNEKKRLQEHREGDERTTLFLFYFHKQMLQYLFYNFEAAETSGENAKQYLDAAISNSAAQFFCFYDSLVKLAIYPSAAVKLKAKLLEEITENQKAIEEWAFHAPMNFRHKFHLVEAERLKACDGEQKLIVEYFESAIALARENKYLSDEALANELMARFWLESGKKEFAGLYLRKAIVCYSQWGAVSKVDQLERIHQQLLSETHLNYPVFREKSCAVFGERGGAKQENLDQSTLMKTAQAISGEVEFNRLIGSFMSIVLENVGARKGVLILKSDNQLNIEASAEIDSDVRIGPLLPVEESDTIPIAIITYVARTAKNVVLDDAIKDNIFIHDRYIKASRPKSILCTAIFHKSEQIGILYLENNLIAGVFHSERLEMVRLLSSQIAISIENARLYSDLKRAEEKYRGIFENAVEGIYQTTPDGQILSANPAMARIFGFDSVKSFLNEVGNFRQLYVNQNRREELLSLLAEDQSLSGFEAEFLRRDGSTFWAALHARPVLDENGSLLYIDGMVTDITIKKRAMETLLESEASLRQENLRLRSDIKERYKFGNIIGKSAVMQEVYDLILQAASNDVNVIVYGESGTGKELVAKAIHEMSHRKEQAFVSVNCGAIPEHLFESEFFGYKKGAFTGAGADKKGYLDLANNGTLFLDEIGDLAANMQVKLLRAMEGDGYMAVGGTELKKSDFRIISATNKELQERVKEGMMREDFLYRIHVIPIQLPPLRDRKEDIPLLIERFFKLHNYDLDLLPQSGRILEALMRYDWPGNVRELQNTLHRFVSTKKIDFLGAHLGGKEKTELLVDDPVLENHVNLKEAMDHFEKKFIHKMLMNNHWHRTKVAENLGISRVSLFKKIKKHELESDSQPVRKRNHK